MPERIVGKVAKVTSDRELILNRGTDDRVEKGMFFYVRDEPIEVLDPDSDEVLGSVAPIKVVVRVEEVSDRFCIARTFRSREVLIEEAVSAGSRYPMVGLGTLGRSLQPPKPAKFETRYETFRFDPQEGEPLDPGESIVAVGDVVESVLAGEDKNPATTTLFR